MNTPRFLAVAALAVVSLVGRAVADPGLVAKYDLNGNALDSSGNGNTATIVGNLTPTTNQLGDPSGALQFDKNGYVAISNTTLLNGATSAAISGWFNDQLAPDQYGFVIGAGDARAGLNPFVLELTGDKVTQALFTDASQGPYGAHRLVGFDDPQYAVTIQENTWVPFLFQFSAAGDQTNFQLYLNGQLAQSLTFDWAAKVYYDTPMPVEIGDLTGFTDAQFVGGIDDVAFYATILPADGPPDGGPSPVPDSGPGLVLALAAMAGLIGAARVLPIQARQLRG